MFDSNKVNQWLNEFGAAKGKNFALNEQGCCVLETDKDIQVQVFGDAQEMFCWFSLSVLTIEDDVSNAHLLQALSLNLYFNRTRDAAIAYDEQLKSLVLNYKMAIQDKDITDFINVLYNLVDTALKLKAELGEPKTQAPAQVAAAGMLRI